MTYEEALKMATVRWAPAGATPREIKDAVVEELLVEGFDVIYEPTTESES